MADIEPAQTRSISFIIRETYYYYKYTHIGIISDAYGDRRSTPYAGKSPTWHIHTHIQGMGLELFCRKPHDQQTTYI